MAGYYDYVLALIPLLLAGIAGFLVTAGWGITAAVPVAAGSSAMVIGHALFVNGPVARAAARGTEGAVGAASAGSPGNGPVSAD